MVEEWTLDDELAATMDADSRLLPWLPELFEGIEELGARSADVLAVLEHAVLPQDARVLDLGCGKGASLLALAGARAVECVGVDGLSAFVEHANARATRLRLDGRVRFIEGDLVELVREAQGEHLDLVMMLAVGPILGEVGETVRALRGAVRPGGYLLLDDAFLAPDSEPPHDELHDCLSYEALVSELTRYGDELVSVHRYEDAAFHAWCMEVAHKVAAHAEALATRVPAVAQPVLEFARRQQEETRDLDERLVGALCLLRRPVDGS